jgi:hypothetical protein
LSFTYTISATLASIIITNLLNAIYYENVIVNESIEKSKIMMNSLKRYYRAFNFPYKNKFFRASIKIKVCLSLYYLYEDMKFKKQNVIKLNSKRLAEIKKMNNKSKKIKNEQNNLAVICKDEFKNVNKKIPKKNNNKNKFFKSPKYLYEHTNDSEINLIILEDNNLIITSFSEKFVRSKWSNSQNKIKIFVTPFSEYSYYIRNQTKKTRIDSFAFQIIDKKLLISAKNNSALRSKIKAYTYVFLFAVSWGYLFIMITDVYNKYEDNMFKISISPLISVLLVKFLITQNIMIFVHTLIMHLYGEKVYMDKRKYMDIKKLIFEYFIPSIAKANHKAILAFNRLFKAIDSDQ